MDPLSITACAVTLSEVAVKSVRLIAMIEDLRSIPERTSELARDVENLRTVEAAVRSFLSREHPEQLQLAMAAILDECSGLLDKLEALLWPCAELRRQGAVVRCRTLWLARARKVKALRERLAETVGSLSLCLAAASTAQLRLPVDLSPDDYVVFTIRKRLIATDGGGLSRPVQLGHDTEPVLVSSDDTFVEPPIPKASGAIGSSDYFTFAPVVTAQKSLVLSRCRCSTKKRKKVWVCARQELGLLICISYSEPLFAAASCQFCAMNFRESSIFQITAFGPRWLSRTGVRLAITSSPRIQACLTFPTIIHPDADLCIQIRNGNCERVRQLLISGEGSVSDIITPFGISPLELSFLYNQTNVSKLLLQAGAKLAAFSSWPVSELFDYMRQYSMIDSSISAFASMSDNARQMGSAWHFTEMETSVEYPALDQYPPSRLVKSIRRLSSEDPLQILAECQDEIHEPDYFGRTPLHLAVLFGQATLVTRLLSQGADLNGQDFNGATPLHMAAGMGLQECVDVLIQSGSILTIHDRWGCPPLHWASNQGQAHIIRDFANKGIALDIRSQLGESLMFYATHTKSFGTVKTLVELGASPTGKDAWGYTPVLDACLTQATDELALFLDAKFSYDDLLNDGQSLLHQAARVADMETLNVLLQADDLSALDPDARDDNHMTAAEYLRQRPDYPILVLTFDALLEKIHRARLQQQDGAARGTACSIEEAVEEDVFHDASEFL